MVIARGEVLQPVLAPMDRATEVTGEMDMAYADSWAHFCVHHFNQDGIVREPPRIAAWLGA